MAKAIVLYLVLLVLAAYSLAPIVWLLDSSLTETSEIASVPPHWIPQNPVVWRFEALILGLVSSTAEDITSGVTGGRAAMWGSTVPKAAQDFRIGLLNSVIVSLFAMAVCVLVASTAGYAYARMKFRGSTALLTFTLGCSLLPPVAVVMPLYFLLNSVNLIDTRWALILINSGFNLPLMVWVGQSFFNALPVELEEAGKIDGCSDLQAFLRITMPLCASGVVAIGIIAFMWSWNDFFFATSFANTLNALTAPALIGQFSTQHVHDWGMMSAAGVVTITIPVIVAVIFQRYMVRGLVEGAIKH
jgi:multiple sugar transport system permease protein